MSKLRVLLLGATGHTGKSILDGLLEYGKYDIEVLVRPSSAEKPEVKKIRERGVKIVIADINAPVDDVVTVLRGVDVLISAIDAFSFVAQKNLATAAKKAGVKRFIPCSWSTIAPAGGVMYMRDEKEEVYNHIKQLYLPFTVIDVGYWYSASFFKVPSGKFDYASLYPFNEIHGDGNTPTILGDLRDIGRWTARIIEDERTLNKFVLAYGDVLSENEIVAEVEHFTEEKVEVKKTPFDEIEAQVKEARANFKKDPANPKNRVVLYKAEYDYTKYLRGDNQPEYAKYLGYVDARELYPDFKPITYREFLKDLQDGKIEKPHYNFEEILGK